MPSSPTGRLVPFPNTSVAQVRVALRHLEAALAEQSAAARRLREENGRLGDAVAGLGGSIGALQHALRSAAAETVRAEKAARELRSTADAMGRVVSG